MANFRWIPLVPSSGDWASAADWTPFGIPGGADTVDIQNGAVTVSNPEAVAVLAGSGGSLTLQTGAILDVVQYAIADTQMTVSAGALLLAGALATPSFDSLSFGDAAGASGSLLVDGGAVTASTLIFAGYDGAGTIDVANGGSLQVNDGVYSLVLGANPGASGLVTFESGARATALGKIDVGDGGVGTLRVLGGAVLASAVAAGEDVAADVGRQATSAGSSALVSGAGSQWSMAGGLEVVGSSTLSVLDGGVVANGRPLGSTYALSAGNSASGGSDTGLIVVAGGSGAVRSTINIGIGSIGLGYDAVGVMFVGQGAQVVGAGEQTGSFNYFNALALGETASGYGFLTISDPGTVMSLTGAVDIGRAGQGAVTVQNGGTLTTGNVDGYQGVEVGRSAGSVGLLTVTGPGSLLINAGRLAVGGAGTGTLEVLAGGFVASTRPAANGGALSISYDAGASGTVIVSGAGSRFAADGQIFVGDGGTGALFVQAGGAVTSTGDLNLGDTASAVGVVVVDGAGSSVTSGGSLYLGASFGAAGYWYLNATGGGRVAVAGSATLQGEAHLTVDAASAVEIGGTSGVSGVGAIQVDAGAVLAGVGTVSGAVVDLGVVGANAAGSLLVSGTASGGIYEASDTGTLVFGGPVTGVISMIWDTNGGTTGTVDLGLGTSTVASTAGPGTIVTAAGQSAVVFAAAGNLVRANSADTIVAGSGAETVAVSGAGALVFAGDAALSFQSLGTASTIVGGTQGVTLLGATGGGEVFGSNVAPNLLATGTGPTTLVGGAGGDVLSANNASSDLLVAGGGAETLGAAGATGFVAMFAGGGADSLQGGAGTTLMIGGAGQATMAGGTGAGVFAFIAGQAGGSDTITGFDASRDLVVLFNYAAGEGSRALAGASVAGGSLVLSLSDGTHITFLGDAAIPPGSLIG